MNLFKCCTKNARSKEMADEEDNKDVQVFKYISKESYFWNIIYQ